jgi:hypothetical protein
VLAEQITVETNIMRMKLVTAFALLALFGAPVGFGQEDFAKHPVPALDLEGFGLLEVMHHIADQTHLTIGVERDVVMAKAGHLELDFPGGTVADLAVKCAALMQGASWKIVNNRSLLVYIPGKAASLSALRIQYPGIVQATRHDLWEDLSNHREVDSWLQKNGCKREEIWMGDRWRGDGPGISIPSGSITLGDLLETAANQSDDHFWSITKNSSDGQQCGVSIWIW